MIKKNKVSGLKYLIIAGAIFAFMVLLSFPEAFAQLTTFSGSGGYGYPGIFYGGDPGYGYPYRYGYQPPPYWYYQPPTLANDFGGSPFGYQQPYNPYGYQQPYNTYSYQQPYNPYADPWIGEGESPPGWQPPQPPPWYTPIYSPHDFSFEYLIRPYYGG